MVEVSQLEIVHSLEDRLGILVGELRGQLSVMRASSRALARRENVIDQGREGNSRPRKPLQFPGIILSLCWRHQRFAIGGLRDEW